MMGSCCSSTKGRKRRGESVDSGGGSAGGGSFGGNDQGVATHQNKNPTCKEIMLKNQT